MSIDELREMMKNPGELKMKVKTCFWCNRDDEGNKIPLPLQETVSYDLCPRCEETVQKDSVLIISVKSFPIMEDQPRAPVSVECYPDGFCMSIPRGLAEAVVKRAMIESFHKKEEEFLGEGKYFLPFTQYLALKVALNAISPKSIRNGLLDFILEMMEKD